MLSFVQRDIDGPTFPVQPALTADEGKLSSCTKEKEKGICRMDWDLTKGRIAWIVVEGNS